MAALVRRDTTAPTTANQATYASASFTPTANDLLVVVVTASATATDPAALTASANGITFTQGFAINNPAVSAGVGIWVFIADQLVGGSPAAMTVTVNFGGDAASGCHIVVLGATGMSRAGSDAIRQADGSQNPAATAPSVTLPAACLTSNPVIAAAINLTGSTSTLTPPSGFTERYDNFYNTPVTGTEVATRDSGHTSATVTGGSNMSAGLYAVVELDSSAATVPWASWGPIPL